MGPALLEGSCERGKVPAPWEALSSAGRFAGTEGTSEPQKRTQQLVCGSQSRGRTTQTVRAATLHSPALDTGLPLWLRAGC